MAAGLGAFLLLYRGVPRSAVAGDQRAHVNATPFPRAHVGGFPQAQTSRVIAIGPDQRLHVTGQPPFPRQHVGGITVALPIGYAVIGPAGLGGIMVSGLRAVPRKLAKIVVLAPSNATVAAASTIVASASAGATAQVGVNRVRNASLTAAGGAVSSVGAVRDENAAYSGAGGAAAQVGAVRDRNASVSSTAGASSQLGAIRVRNSAPAAAAGASSQVGAARDRIASISAGGGASSAVTASRLKNATATAAGGSSSSVAAVRVRNAAASAAGGAAGAAGAARDRIASAAASGGAVGSIGGVRDRNVTLSAKAGASSQVDAIKVSPAAVIKNASLSAAGGASSSVTALSIGIKAPPASDVPQVAGGSDIIAAVRGALADYLRAYLAPLLPVDNATGKTLLTVRESWPEPSQLLNEYDVTIMATGEADDWYLCLPDKNSVVQLAPPLGIVTYSYGYIHGLQLELDIFASTPAKRALVSKLLRGALNRPSYKTVTSIPAPMQPLPDRSPGLVLSLPLFFDTLCSFEFAPSAAPAEASDSAQVGEWRAHLRGSASLAIRDQQIFALIKRIGMTVKVDGIAEPIRSIA